MKPLNKLHCYINGAFCGSESYFDNINPVNGEKIADIAEASEAQIDSAANAAKQALCGEWGQLSAVKRSEYLHKVADAIEARLDDFIAAEMADTGKSLQQLTTIDIPRAAANFRLFADLIKFEHGESFVSESPTGDQVLNYSVNKPLGVVAIISPWNLPLLLTTWKIAPALACGNTVIVKPSEETSSTAYLLAEVIDQVGLPKGAFNLLLGRGHVVGDHITQHEHVDAVTFTGASATGQHIMRQVADKVKPISFELGGKNAAVVFNDADLEQAIAGVARSSFTNCGQVCLCTERVFVHRDIYSSFVSGLVEKAKQIKIGYPTDESVFIGPLISQAHQSKVLSYYQKAKQDGAEVLTGGGVPIFDDERDNGSYIQPTVISGLADDHAVNQEEIFGPICHISVFDDELEVIDRVNNTQYGLACSLWTTNLSRAHRVAPKIDVGLVWVNTWFLRDLRTPFGGVKMSGIGREGGRHSLSFYSEPINICINIDPKE